MKDANAAMTQLEKWPENRIRSEPEFFQVIFPVVSRLHSHLSFFQLIVELTVIRATLRATGKEQSSAEWLMFDHSCSIANDPLNKADEQINKQTTITSFSRVGFASRRKRHTKLLCCWLTRHSGDLSTSVLFCLERRQRKPMVVCYYARWDNVSKS